MSLKIKEEERGGMGGREKQHRRQKSLKISGLG
jgi:hypothetical protein